METDECMTTDEHNRQMRDYGSCTRCGMGFPKKVCQECGTPLGQPHGWGCDLVLHGDLPLTPEGQPPLVTEQDTEE